MDSVDGIFEEITQDVKIEAKEELDALVKDEELPETLFQNTLFVLGCRAVGAPAIKWYNRYFSLFPGIKRHRVVVDRDTIKEIAERTGFNSEFDLCVQFDSFLGSIDEIESFLDMLKIVMKTVHFNNIFINRLGRTDLKFIKLYNYLNGTQKLISSELSNRLIKRQIRITNYNDNVIADSLIKFILRNSLRLTTIEKKFSGGYLFDDLYINDKLDESIRKMMHVYEIPFDSYSKGKTDSFVYVQDYEYSNEGKEKIDEWFFNSQTLRFKRGCILEACATTYDVSFHYYLCLELKEIIVDYELVKRFVVFKLPYESSRLYYYLMLILSGPISNVRRIIDEAEIALERKSFSFSEEKIIGSDSPYVFR